MSCRQLLEQDPDLVARRAVEPGEGFAPLGRQREDTLPAIGPGGRPREQPTLLEPPQDAAQVAGIQAQLLPQRGRVGGRLGAELVQDAGLGEREGTLEQRLPQEPDLPGIEPIEAAHGGDALRGSGPGQNDPHRKAVPQRPLIV